MSREALKYAMSMLRCGCCGVDPHRKGVRRRRAQSDAAVTTARNQPSNISHIAIPTARHCPPSAATVMQLLLHWDLHTLYSTTILEYKHPSAARADIYLWLISWRVGGAGGQTITATAERTVGNKWGMHVVVCLYVPHVNVNAIHQVGVQCRRNSL